jgi:hypothetical protein
MWLELRLRLMPSGVVAPLVKASASGNVILT